MNYNIIISGVQITRQELAYLEESAPVGSLGELLDYLAIAIRNYDLKGYKDLAGFIDADNEEIIQAKVRYLKNRCGLL